MKTMREAREKLTQLCEALENGSMDFKTICEMHNGIGKIINTIRTQLEYNKLMKRKDKIVFMECE